MLSAGSTGALMVSALQYIGTLPGIERPVAGGAFLQLSPNCVVLDLGANVGCQPYQLVNVAVVGVIYARSFLSIDNPTVGLLNVGAEEGKGNEQAKEAYLLLKKSGLNFVGNVEGMDYALKRELIGYLTDYCKRGNTVVMVTHDVETAAECADRVILLSEGRVVVDGSKREVLSKALLFSPQINRLSQALSSYGVSDTTLTIDEMIGQIV